MVPFGGLGADHDTDQRANDFLALLEGQAFIEAGTDFFQQGRSLIRHGIVLSRRRESGQARLGRLVLVADACELGIELVVGQLASNVQV